MGAVYLGKRIGAFGFEKEVVLKQLLPELTNDREITELFIREARLTASLDHQNIVHTMDLLQVEGSYYMVMEYIRGADLRTLLRRTRRQNTRFCAAAALLIGRDLLDALDYAHKKQLPDGSHLGLIHRDISPSNILLSTSGEVRLTDFGIAKAATHFSTRYQIRGKLGYMSPEQARGEELDARSDLFSLAVVLYEVLSGQRLFIGDKGQSPAQIYCEPVPPLSRVCPEVPPDFDRVMGKALALSRGDRFQTALEFHEALSGLAQRHGMLIGHAELAIHLRQICGASPKDWLRDDDRTGTAAIDAGSLGDDIADDIVDDIVSERIISSDDEYENRPITPPPPETTSRVPIERLSIPPDTTQPMPRQSVEEVGIAEMARRMVTQVLKAQPEGGPKSPPPPPGKQPRGEETQSVGHPNATKRLLMLDSIVMDPPGGQDLQAGAVQTGEGPVLRLRWPFVTVAVFFLVLVGVLIGMLFSMPRSG